TSAPPPLKNSVGFPPPRALPPGAPAIDTGSNFVVTTIDQRGFNRPVNGVNDIGAYEYQPPATATTLTSSPNPSTLGQAVAFTATVTGLASNSNNPSGTVTFFDAALTRGTTALAG